MYVYIYIFPNACFVTLALLLVTTNLWKNLNNDQQINHCTFLFNNNTNKGIIFASVVEAKLYKCHFVYPMRFVIYLYIEKTKPWYNTPICAVHYNGNTDGYVEWERSYNLLHCLLSRCKFV